MHILLRHLNRSFFVEKIITGNFGNVNKTLKKSLLSANSVLVRFAQEPNGLITLYISFKDFFLHFIS